MVFGTGSMPPGANGRQRRIRFKASQEPCATPWRSMASRAYEEQVGWYLHADKARGESAILYAQSRVTAIRWGTVSLG